MKRLWLVAGIGALIAVIVAIVLMSGVVEAPVEAPLQQEEESAGQAGTVNFETVEKEVSRKEEPGVEIDGTELTVHAGAKPTGGYSIEIDRIVETEEVLRVYVTEVEPRDCMVTQAFTYPHASVRLDRQVTKPVEVITEREFYDC